MNKYPRISDRGPSPKSHHHGRKSWQQMELEGRIKQGLSYGKPCLICGRGTTRKAWVEVNWFRGEDIELRVCCDCAKTPSEELLRRWSDGGGNCD